MKMIQTLYPCNQGWTEVFYDGELAVVNNMVEVPANREHWINILAVERGFIEVYDEVEEVVPVTTSPAKRVTKPKESTHGRE